MRPKLLILLPDGKIHKLKLFSHIISFREAPLTATTLAALTPPELDFEITVCDASVSPVPARHHFDLVAISIKRRVYPVTRLGNLGCRLYIQRLVHDRERIHRC